MEGTKMTIKLSNMKLYMSSIVSSSVVNGVRMLIISTVLAAIIISVQSCDEQETSPAYAKTINLIN